MSEALAFQLLTVPQVSDLSRERGIGAYRWMSHTPERRADGDIAGYIKMVLDFAEALSPYAVTDAQKAEAAAQTEAYRLKLISWEYTLWASKARTASPMITGPANFPVARNNKAMNAEAKKVGAYLEWLPKAKASAIKAVKIAGVTLAERNIAAPETVTVNGVDIVKNHEIERVQLFFPGKPDSETIGQLKGAGWNWSPRNKAWQRMITDATLRSANAIAGRFTAAALSEQPT